MKIIALVDTRLKGKADKKILDQEIKNLFYKEVIIKQKLEKKKKDFLMTYENQHQIAVLE